MLFISNSYLPAAFRQTRDAVSEITELLFFCNTNSGVMPLEPCFNRLWSEEILRNVTPRRADNRVKKMCREYFPISPGYIFRDVTILLEKPMLCGIDEEKRRVLIPFRKPCYGTSLYAIDSDEQEMAALREAVGKTGDRKEGTRRPADRCTGTGKRRISGDSHLPACCED